jgi:hypothetical protein
MKTAIIAALTVLLLITFYSCKTYEIKRFLNNHIDTKFRLDIYPEFHNGDKISAEFIKNGDYQGYNNYVRETKDNLVSADGGKTWSDACEYEKEHPYEGGSGGYGYKNPDGSTTMIPNCGEPYTIQ